jgi:predicted nucleic acid-binding Zn ribbon protein
MANASRSSVVVETNKNIELDRLMTNAIDFQIRPEVMVSETALEARRELSSSPSARPALLREIAPRRAEHRCPTCQSIVYSRRHRLCGVCSEPLPEEFLFSVTEARRVEELIESDRQRHRRWLARV